MWDLLGAAMVAAGAWLIYTVLVKKFPQLKLIDLSTLAKERHAEVKARIMRDRFDRSLGRLQSKTSGAWGRAVERLRGLYDKAHGSLKEMESGIDRRTPRTPQETEDRFLSEVARADRLREDGLFEEAERLLIGLLKRDPKRADVYRGLADIYIAQRLYDQAAETLEFLLRLDANDDRAAGRLGEVEAQRGNWQKAEERYLEAAGMAPATTGYRAELGRVYLATGQGSKAVEQFRTVLQAEPHNPKYLDYFLEACLLVGDAESAAQALEGLAAVNPDNAKLEEFRGRIAALRQPQRTD